MIRIVLDTNVFMSGVFWGGYPSKILDAWHDKKVKIVVSPEIIDEYIRIGNELSKKYFATDVLQFIELITIYGELVTPKTTKYAISRDKDDDKFVIAAMEAKCKLVVSGDKDLLSLNEYLGIKMIKPSNFVKQYLK